MSPAHMGVKTFFRHKCHIKPLSPWKILDPFLLMTKYLRSPHNRSSSLQYSSAALYVFDESPFRFFHFVSHHPLMQIVTPVFILNNTFISDKNNITQRETPRQWSFFFSQKVLELFFSLKNSFGSYVGNLGAQGLSGSRPGVIWSHIGVSWGSYRGQLGVI